MKRKSSASSDVCSPAKKPRKGSVPRVDDVKADEANLPGAGGDKICSGFSAFGSSLRQVFQNVRTQLDDGNDVEDLCHQGVVTLSKIISLYRSKVSAVSNLQQQKMQAQADSEKAHNKKQNFDYEHNSLRQKIAEAGNSLTQSEVALVSEEEFASNAPQQLKDLAQVNEHMHHLARLQYEVLHRAKLSQDLKSMQRQVASVSKEISTCERQHEVVTTELRQLLEVAKNFEKKTCVVSQAKPTSQSTAAASSNSSNGGEDGADDDSAAAAAAAAGGGGDGDGITTDAEQDNRHPLVIENVDLLPEPLYVLCKQAQLAASSSTSPGKCLDITVQENALLGSLHGGSGSAATHSLLAIARAQCSELPVAEDVDFLKPHPYSCCVAISPRASSSSAGSVTPVVLQFFYHPSLQLVSVDHNVTGSDLLDRVQPSDTGLSCPRILSISANKAYSPTELALLIENGAVGRLYRWAQHLAGLKYLPLDVDRDDESSKLPCTWNSLLGHLL